MVPPYWLLVRQPLHLLFLFWCGPDGAGEEGGLAKADGQRAGLVGEAGGKAWKNN